MTINTVETLNLPIYFAALLLFFLHLLGAFFIIIFSQEFRPPFSEMQIPLRFVEFDAMFICIAM